MTSREDNDAQSASSVETGRATERESSMILMRRILKQCRSYKSSHCKLLLVMTHSHSPPVCADLTTAPLQLYAFSACGKT